MIGYLSNLIGNPYITTFIISLIPTIELKGGIVFARGAGLDFFTALLIAFLGSTAVFFLIFFLLKPILGLLKKIKFFNGFAEKIENYFKKKADSAVGDEKKSKGKLSENALKFLSVLIFVAIPLPLTGVWTGTAVAVFLDMKFSHAALAVTVGNFIAGILISLLAELCSVIGVNLDYVLYALLALALIAVVITVIKICKKPNGKEE